MLPGCPWQGPAEEQERLLEASRPWIFLLLQSRPFPIILPKDQPERLWGGLSCKGFLAAQGQKFPGERFNLFF